MKGNKAIHVARHVKTVARKHVTLFSPEEHVVAAQLAVFLAQLKLKSLCPDWLMSQLLTTEIFPSERLIDLDLTLIAPLQLLPSVERKANLCCPLFTGVLYPPPSSLPVCVLPVLSNPHRGAPLPPSSTCPHGSVHPGSDVVEPEAEKLSENGL